jgi:hypothetical protein
MPEITTAGDAQRQARRTYDAARDLESITAGDGRLLGWTFATEDGDQLTYGWILTDGRVSPATEWSRSDAEAYTRRTLANY